ncbi:MAG: sulfatase [Verrucomicrobiales bacterium]|nr:sulfatase [Verrucomicrobiales bacterium]
MLLAAGAVHAADRPNIVFILADDLAWSDLACYGHPFHETPNLDRLAAQGMRFTQAYAPAPICSASRVAILTGKTPARLGFEFVTKDKAGTQPIKDTPLKAPPFTLNLPLEEVTMAEALAPAGYATGFYGKWHVSQHHGGYLGWSPTHGPLQQGFAEGSSDFGSHPYAYRNEKDLKDREVEDGTFPEDTLTDQAIDFLRRHRDERFFLDLCEYYVHDPIHSRCTWLIEKYRAKLPKGSLPIRADYAAMVETLDHNVGRILHELDALHLTNDTLVVFMADNGGHPDYTTNAPLRGSKWNLYEGGIRVPFIVRWPGHVKPGVVSDTVVTGCDLFPTFCEVADAHPPEAERDGVSLLPAFATPGLELVRSQPLVWHFPYYHPEKNFHARRSEIGVGDFETSQTRPHSALRIGDEKLLLFEEDGSVELYRLSDDLGEQQELSNREADVAERLRERLLDYLQSVDARHALPRHP